jgi:hypothetical protein
MGLLLYNNNIVYRNVYGPWWVFAIPNNKNRHSDSSDEIMGICHKIWKILDIHVDLKQNINIWNSYIK